MKCLQMHRVTAIGELYTQTTVVTYALRTLLLGAFHDTDSTPFAQARADALGLVQDTQVCPPPYTLNPPP